MVSSNGKDSHLIPEQDVTAEQLASAKLISSRTLLADENNRAAMMASKEFTKLIKRASIPVLEEVTKSDYAGIAGLSEAANREIQLRKGEVTKGGFAGRVSQQPGVYAGKQ